MTSFIIKSHVGRQIPSAWAHDDNCAFCRIIRGELPSSTVYETEKVIAILDILPLRAGHTLVIPKAHIPKLSDLPPDLASAVGKAISKVANALTEVMGNTGLNVVCNQEYAQAVPHVHYHIIPAPQLESSSPSSTKAVGGQIPLTHTEMHQKEFESRHELDDGDADVLVKRIRARL
ncbi:HIT-like protein [Phlegmacium glaucopus]|nr:HIT-like protein [Phlegmacium glaucopus]